MKTNKKAISFALAITIVASGMGIGTINSTENLLTNSSISASAVSTLYAPSLTGTNYIIWWCTGKTTVYTTSSCKTAGSSTNKSGSNPKAYNAYIDKGDQCYIFKITSSYAFVKYPAGSSYKYGYIKISSVSSRSETSSAFSAKSGVNTYGNTDLKTKIGSISKGDKIYLLDCKSSKYQLIYPLSGSSNYKIGWVSSSDYQKLKNSTTNSGKTYYVTTKAGLNLRSSASSSSSKVAAMPYGSAITVYSTSNGWAYCKYGTKTGYCSTSYISTTKPSSSSSSTTNSSTTNLSYALYKNSKAVITCGFDGYTNKTNSRHEGIDICLSNGSKVYSLTDGVVTRVANGYNGSSGLSTIAIYNSATNKTVVYLHSAPSSKLYVGKTVTKGEEIATQAWRGVSSSSAGHTHVEVVNGRATAANKSLNDPVLNNENPTAFWNQMGYNVK